MSNKLTKGNMLSKLLVLSVIEQVNKRIPSSNRIIDMETEYELIQKKKSKLPAARRGAIVRAYEAKKQQEDSKK